MPLTGMPMLSTSAVQLVRRNDLADRLLDFGELPRGLLDAGADMARARASGSGPPSTEGKKSRPR